MTGLQLLAQLLLSEEQAEVTANAAAPQTKAQNIQTAQVTLETWALGALANVLTNIVSPTNTTTASK